MSDLYELTRKLVARGCPEHPRLECCGWKDDRSMRDVSRVVEETEGTYKRRSASWVFFGVGNPHALTQEADTCIPLEDDACDLWAAHALRWWQSAMPKPLHGDDVRKVSVLSADGQSELVLEAIEAATRYLEPA